jgi:hypothetical protein
LISVYIILYHHKELARVPQHHNITMMKNPVFFSNNDDQVVFIFHIYDTSIFQIGTIYGQGSTILNIPVSSFIHIKKGNLVGDIIVPNETILETQIFKETNHIII